MNSAVCRKSQIKRPDILAQATEHAEPTNVAFLSAGAVSNEKSHLGIHVCCHRSIHFFSFLTRLFMCNRSIGTFGGLVCGFLLSFSLERENQTDLSWEKEKGKSIVTWNLKLELSYSTRHLRGYLLIGAQNYWQKSDSGISYATLRRCLSLTVFNSRRSWQIMKSL